MNSYFHPTALVESNAVGANTRVWAFAHILAGAVIGAECNIGDHCFIESGVVIGDEVVVKNGVALWQGTRLGDRVFIGPNAAFTNDLFPRAKVFHAEYESTWIQEGASIGANATVLCGLTIGRYAMIGAGAVITHDVPAYALVYGNPARQHGWICVCGQALAFIESARAQCPCGRSYELVGGRVQERTGN